MYLYPEQLGTINSWSETALGVGYSVGPAIGGLLYDAGGFHLPFVAVGLANILFAMIIILALPSKEFHTRVLFGQPGRRCSVPIDSDSDSAQRELRRGNGRERGVKRLHF